MTKIKYPLIIDRELWNKFKAKCATKGISMAKAITDFIKEFVGRV